MASRPATINDVAALAGVSRQTVTRAVNDMPGISVDTRERVLAAARELRYRPSRFGRGLVNPRAQTLGLLIDDLGNPYYAELASEILELASAAGWNVLLAERAHAADQFSIDGFADQVDAIVSFISAGLPRPGDGLPDLPLVEIDPPATPMAHGSVRLNRGLAVRQAVRHLARPRCPAPSATRPPRRQPASRAVPPGVRRHWRRIRPDRLPDDGSAGGFEAARRLLAERPDTDAMVAFNDVMALGVLRALRLADVSVPQRIRVLGVDGLEIGRYFSPRLSTLALDMAEVARSALDLVLAIRGDPTGLAARDLTRRIDYTFDVGEST